MNNTMDATTELNPEDSSNAVKRINGIPVTTIEAFEALRQRKLAICARSAKQLEKRTRKRKCKKKKLDKHEGDIQKKSEPATGTSSSITLTTATDSTVDQKWQLVRQLLNVNSHLSGPIGHGVRQPKSGMECEINEAIADGNFEKADLLSDQLATREFSVRAAKAFAAKRYLDEKEEAKNKQIAKTRMKLHWGFEAKQRWEMKGNM